MDRQTWLIVLHNATQCYSVLLSAAQCYSVLLCATQCYSVLLSATQCYSVLLSATQCYSVLLSGTKCYSVLLSVTTVTQLIQKEHEKFRNLILLWNLILLELVELKKWVTELISSRSEVTIPLYSPPSDLSWRKYAREKNRVIVEIYKKYVQ